MPEIREPCELIESNHYRIVSSESIQGTAKVDKDMMQAQLHNLSFELGRPKESPAACEIQIRLVDHSYPQ